MSTKRIIRITISDSVPLEFDLTEKGEKAALKYLEQQKKLHEGHTFFNTPQWKDFLSDKKRWDDAQPNSTNGRSLISARERFTEKVNALKIIRPEPLKVVSEIMSIVTPPRSGITYQRTPMAPRKKKTAPIATTTIPHSDITKARFDIEAELKLLYALLPELDEEGQKKLDQISGSIDDCIDIIRNVEDNMDEEIKDLKKQLSDTEDRVKELETEAQAEIDPEELDDAVLLHVFGSKPIVVIPQNTIDEQFIEVLTELANKISADPAHAVT